MTETGICPFCNSACIVPTGYMVGDEKVDHCMECESDFTREGGETVVWVWDGGDDHPNGSFDDMPF